MPSMVKYNSCLKQQMNGGNGTAALVIDYDTDTIKVMLVTSSYVPNYATHVTKADITNEVTGTGYTAGGAILTSKTLTESAGLVTFDADNVTWSQNPAGFTNARYAICYKSTGVDATSSLIGCYDLLTNQSNTIIPFNLIFDVLGIIQWA